MSARLSEDHRTVHTASALRGWEINVWRNIKVLRLPYVIEKCGVKFADAQYDSSTPTFEPTKNGSDSTGLKVWTCEADHGGKAEVDCRYY